MGMEREEGRAWELGGVLGQHVRGGGHSRNPPPARRCFPRPLDISRTWNRKVGTWNRKVGTTTKVHSSTTPKQVKRVQKVADYIQPEEGCNSYDPVRRCWV